MHWSADYIGLPWADRGRTRDGLDCYGLLCVVYREVLGITLASYAEGYTTTEERAEIAALLADAKVPPWHPVPFGEEREFDMALFRRAGLDSHVGLVTGKGEMLHINGPEAETRIERFDKGYWRPKLVSICRHMDLLNG